MPSNTDVGPAGAADWRAARQLLCEYAAWIHEAAGIDPFAVQPSFRIEVDALEKTYTPPAGRLIVARVDGEPVGTTAVVTVGSGVAELRRVYVRPSARGHRFGERMLVCALHEAGRLGADTVRLETMPGPMAHAYRMYEAYGFRHIASFEDVHVNGMVYMERPLELHAAAAR